MMTDLLNLASEQRALKPADRSADDWEVSVHMPLSQLEQLIRDHSKLEEIRTAERRLSMAYVRLRALIPGAFDTPRAPSGEEIWYTTEEALKTYKAKLEDGLGDAHAKLEYLAKFVDGEDGTFTFPDGDTIPCKKV